MRHRIPTARSPKCAAALRPASPRDVSRWRGALLLLGFTIAGCTGDGREPVGLSETVEPSSPRAYTEISERSPRNAPMPPGFDTSTWTDILRAAEGQSVTWHLRGDDPRILAFARGYVADMAAGRYGIDLRLESEIDIMRTVDSLLEHGDGGAGRSEGPVPDLLWIDGDGFGPLKDAGALFGPWTQAAPSGAHIDLDAEVNAFDLGVPVDNLALPWGRTQLVVAYDGARIDRPGRTASELLDHAAAKPGRVTYPAPPDPTGSAVVRQLCLALVGGSDALPAPRPGETVDPALLAPCWSALREAAGGLWRAGSTYPSTADELDALFAAGEVDFTFSVDPIDFSRRIVDGVFPETVRTFVLEDGSLSDTHYLVIPERARSKAAAMVLANFLASPEAQYAKAQPSVWGDLPAVDTQRLPEAWAAAFEALDVGPAIPPFTELARSGIPEPRQAWIEAIEEGWAAEVRQR